jgi:hypothetical protein
MKALRIGLGLAVIAAVGLVPSTASARSLVPPGNSGANQYQETLPAAGGQELPPGNSPAPAKILGPAKAHRLEQLGSAGRAAAALAAATAPQRRAATGHPDRVTATHSDEEGAASSGEPSGSPGWHEVLDQVTGSTSSGKTGLLLPLTLVAAFLGAVVYAARRRHADHGS